MNQQNVYNMEVPHLRTDESLFFSSSAIILIVNLVAGIPTTQI